MAKKTREEAIAEAAQEAAARHRKRSQALKQKGMPSEKKIRNLLNPKKP